MGWRVVWYHRESGNGVALVGTLKRSSDLLAIFIGDGGVEASKVPAREAKYMRDGVPGRPASSPKRAARALLRAGRRIGIGKRARKILRRVAGIGVDKNAGGE